MADTPFSNSLAKRGWLADTTGMQTVETLKVALGIEEIVSSDQFQAGQSLQDIKLGALEAAQANLVALVGTLLPGSITLQPLTLDSSNFTQNSAFTVNIIGKSPGSTVTAISSEGSSLGISGAVMTGTFLGAGPISVTLLENLTGSLNNPNYSTIPLNVAAAVQSLNALDIDGTLQIGVLSTVHIVGFTTGSTIASNIPGMGQPTFAAGVWTMTGTPTGSAASIPNALVETLAGYSNSPRSSAVTVNAASIVLGTLTLDQPLQIGNATTGNIIGATSGSTITKSASITGLTVNPDRTFTWAGTGTTGNFADGLTETLAGAVGSPKTSTLNVAAATPTLQTLSLSPGNLRNGVSGSGSVIGLTAGSTSLTTGITGLTFTRSGTSATATYTWTGGGTAGAYSNGLVETYGAATNSPRSTSLTILPAAGALAYGSTMAVIGNSIFPYGSPSLQVMLEKLGGSLYVPSGYNRAVAGTKVDTTDTGDQDFANYQTPQVTALVPLPDCVFVGGFHNDGSQGVPASDIRAGYTKIISQLNAVGINKIFMQTTSSTWAGARGANTTKDGIFDNVNAWIRALPATYSNVFVLDVAEGSADLYDFLNASTGAAPKRFGYNGGTGHPNQRGGIDLGTKLYNQMAATGAITSGSLLPSTGLPAANKNPYGLMAGTGGTKPGTDTGSVATNYTASNSTGVAAVYSKETVSGSHEKQVIALTGTPTAKGEVSLTVTVPLSGATVKAGEGWEWVVEAEWSNNAGSDDAVGLYRTSLNSDASGVSSTVVLGRDFQTAGQDNVAGGGGSIECDLQQQARVMRTLVSLAPNDMTNPQLKISFYFDNTRDIDAKLKVGRVMLRRIPEEPKNRVITLDAFIPNNAAEGTAAGSGPVIQLTARRKTDIGAATVNYATTGDVNGADFVGGVLPSGTITIPDGSTSATVNVQVAADGVDEPDENAIFTLSSPSIGYTLGGSISQTFQITNDDGAVSYDSDAAALFGRMATAGTEPNTTRKGAINQLIKDLKAGYTSGADQWARMQRIYVPAAHSEAAARLEWKGNDANNLVAGNGSTTTTGGTFTVDRGFTYNGVDQQETSLYTPATRDNQSISVWSLNSAQMAGSTCLIGTTTASIQPRTTADAVAYRANDNATNAQGAGTITDGTGFYVSSRAVSNAHSVWKNGTQVGTTHTQTSIAPTGTFRMGSQGGAQLGVGQIAFGHVGNALSTTVQNADVYNAVRAYMTAVGVP